MNTRITLLTCAVACAAACTSVHARRDPFEAFERLWGMDIPAMMVMPNLTSHSAPVSETENEFIYEYEVPGRSNDQITIEVDSETRMLHVTIAGRTSHHSEQTREGLVTRSHSSSSRQTEEAFRLPEKADLAKVSWNTQNGILQIRVGKRNELQASNRRTIEPSSES